MFKHCNKCGRQWETRKSFLNDKEIVIVGYQVHFEELMLGLFLFNHGCKTTLSLSADLFIDLYDGPVFSERVIGTEKCPGFCLDQSNLSPCPASCECAYVRETMQIIKNWN